MTSFNVTFVIIKSDNLNNCSSFEDIMRVKIKIKSKEEIDKSITERELVVCLFLNIDHVHDHYERKLLYQKTLKLIRKLFFFQNNSQN